MHPVRGQDILIAAGLFALNSAHGAQSELARRLDLPRSRISESVRRLRENGVYSDNLGRLRHQRLRALLLEGLPWMIPARVGGTGVGLPTGHSGPLLSDRLAWSIPYVWPTTYGDVEGRTVEPIHRLAPSLCSQLPAAYALLSLADAVRLGRVRERQLAAQAMSDLLVA